MPLVADRKLYFRRRVAPEAEKETAVGRHGEPAAVEENGDAGRRPPAHDGALPQHPLELERGDGRRAEDEEDDG